MSYKQVENPHILSGSKEERSRRLVCGCPPCTRWGYLKDEPGQTAACTLEELTAWWRDRDRRECAGKSCMERQDSWKEAGVLHQLRVWAQLPREGLFQPKPISPPLPQLCLFPLLCFVDTAIWSFIICVLSHAPESSELIP